MLDSTSEDGQVEGTGAGTESGSSSSTDASDATTDSDDGSTDTTGGEEICELDAIAPGVGTVEAAWAIGPDAIARDIATDPSGNVVAIGTFGSADFGAGPVTAIEDTAFVVKYDPAGVLSWVATLPIDDFGLELTVAADELGDVLAAGNFGGENLVKLDGATGEQVWASNVTGALHAHDVGVFPGGDAVVFAESTSPFVDDDTSVYRIDSSDGTLVWSTLIAEPGGNAIGVALAVSGDNVVWGGGFDGTISTAAGDFVSSDDANDLTVVMIDGGGALQWAYVALGLNGAGIETIAADPCGGVYIYGTLSGGLDAGLGELLAGSQDPFLIRVDAGGSPQWARTFPSESTTFAEGIATDSQGSVLVTGRSPQIDFGTGFLLAPAGSGFLAKIDRDGNTQWAHLFATATISETLSASFDPQGDAWVAGIFRDSLDIGGIALHPTGVVSFSTYIARFQT